MRHLNSSFNKNTTKMNTNHNRIKVADLETNQPDKILTTNSTGELEFSNLNNIKIDSYNGLDYTIEGKALDARQGKELKNLIDTKTNSKIDKAFGPSQANKLLGTDANGDLKLFSMVTYPAPFLEEVFPPSILPNTTGNITLKGSFFTPDMTVLINGQTVNFITFLNDNLIKVNLTTSSLEGNFNITLNNGLSTTFTDSLLVVLGTVYKPTSSDWTSVSNIDVTSGDYAKVVLQDVAAQGQWTPPIDYTKNFRISFKFTPTPLNPNANGNSYFRIYDILGNHVVSFRQIFNLYVYYGNNNTLATNVTYDITKKLEIRKIGSLITLHADDGTLIFTLSDYITLTRNCYILLNMTNFDISEVKYIVTN